MTESLRLASGFYGFAALAVFAVAYVFVLTEEFTGLRKSTPMVLASGVIWALVAVGAAQANSTGTAGFLRHNLLEFAELFLFLLAAMTYVNTLQERGVFGALRTWLVGRGYQLRTMFWITGMLAFLLSPLIDNLTAALVMGAVVLAIGRAERAFAVPALINIVVAANAGGAFSPFGDVTTLMVWQKEIIHFTGFFALFLPSLVNWLVPAAILSFTVPRTQPSGSAEQERMKSYAWGVIALFAMTVTGTVLAHHFLHLPAFLGMMTGLGALKILGYFVRRTERRDYPPSPATLELHGKRSAASAPFDVFVSMKQVEWDTLLFFYGVILCIGGLAACGYLHVVAAGSYGALGATVSNVLVGVASAIFDNIPIMFAVLSIEPHMSQGQWLLVTLTAGVGGSLLSVGSAAGVAIMGQAHGIYTFMAHLRWTWAISLGFAASIATHFLVNGGAL